MITVILKVWEAPGLGPANEKLIYTVWPKFTVDGLAEMVPVTAHPEGMKVGISTRERATIIKNSLTFLLGLNLNRATASFSPLGPFAQSLDS